MKIKPFISVAMLTAVWLLPSVRAEIPAEGITYEEAFREAPAKPGDPYILYLDKGRVYLPRVMIKGDIVTTPQGMSPTDITYVPPKTEDPTIPRGPIKYVVRTWLPCAKAKNSNIPVMIPLEPGNTIYLWRPLDPGEVVIPPKGMKLEDLHIVTPSKRDPRVPYHHSIFQVYRAEPREPLWVSRPVPNDDVGAAVPVLPIGADQLDQGTIYGNVYSVYDKAGKNYSGVVVGDSSFSITYPMGEGDPVMKSGDMVISLGR